MNVYMCVYNIYRSGTRELCQKDSCFQTAFHSVHVGAVSSYCLVPTGGHWSTWEAVILLGGVVPNASHLAVPKLQKIFYLTYLCMAWNIVTVKEFQACEDATTLTKKGFFSQMPVFRPYLHRLSQQHHKGWFICQMSRLSTEALKLLKTTEQDFFSCVAKHYSMCSLLKKTHN